MTCKIEIIFGGCWAMNVRIYFPIQRLIYQLTLEQGQWRVANFEPILDKLKKNLQWQKKSLFKGHDRLFLSI